MIFKTKINFFFSDKRKSYTFNKEIFFQNSSTKHFYLSLQCIVKDFGELENLNNNRLQTRAKMIGNSKLVMN